MIKIQAYSELKKHFRIPDEAIAFLENATPDTENGKYPFGEDCFINVMDAQTKSELADMEAHDVYVDVQCLLAGEEKIFYTDKAPLTMTLEKEGKDCKMYAWETAEAVTYKAGEGIILIPCEAHLPNRAVNEPMAIKKAVVKIKYSARI